MSDAQEIFDLCEKEFENLFEPQVPLQLSQSEEFSSINDLVSIVQAETQKIQTLSSEVTKL